MTKLSNKQYDFLGMTYTYDSPSEKTDGCGMNTITGFGTCFDFDDDKEKQVGTISAPHL